MRSAGEHLGAPNAERAANTERPAPSAHAAPARSRSHCCAARRRTTHYRAARSLPIAPAPLPRR
eukprot:scaffold37505_cov33-Phaeocystis_antarctica.AAC.2